MHLRLPLACLLLLLATTTGVAAEQSEIKAGDKLLRFTVDFVSGPHAGHCGCPATMIANVRARGLVIVAKDAQAAFALARQHEARVDGKQVVGHVVILNGERKSIAEQCNQAKLTAFDFSMPRSSGGKYLDAALGKQGALVVETTGKQVERVSFQE